MTARIRSAGRRIRHFGVAALTASSALAALAPLSAQLLRIGPELAVNTTTTGSQFAPAVAGQRGGPFLVVWQSADQDGSGAGIYARLFDSTGTALTGEIHVPQTTTGEQITPAVAYSPSGTFLVAWAASAQDGSGYGIFARRLQAASGQLLGDEFAVNVSTVGNQIAPRVAAQSGGFFVAWSGLGAGGDTNEIFARGFSAATGTATTGEVRLNSTVSGNQVQPALAASGNGVVAAWASDGQDGSGFGVVARRFDNALAPLSSEIPVPQHSIFDQTAPAVTGLDGTGFAVAWQRSLQAFSSTVGPQPVISLRRFDGDAATGPERQVQDDVSRRHESPVVVADSTATVTVAWQEIDLDSGDKQVVASRFDAANAPVVLDFPLNTTSAGDQIGPALFGSSRLVAAWASFGQDGSSFGIFAQRLGSPVDPCVADATTLCLLGNRFRIRATYATAAGATGSGQAVALTPESGYYWFFDDANVEVVIKVIDACGLAGFDNFWVFATGLTNVEVNLEVIDTWTGEEKIYPNALNHAFDPILDSGHFDVCGAAEPFSETVPPAARAGFRGHIAGANAFDPGDPARPRNVSPVVRYVSPVARNVSPVVSIGEDVCTPDATTLCLHQGRFEVKIDFATAGGATGDGQAVALTDESGYFWFFDDANVELVIKVIDGCGFNNRYWVFAGGLTNVETHLTVRDTSNPTAVFTRDNPLNQDFAPILAIDAFATCAP